LEFWDGCYNAGHVLSLVILNKPAKVARIGL
jgi:hypothetical protein